jgi:parvulin-like peptidyl-prolyl isomerase
MVTLWAITTIFRKLVFPSTVRLAIGFYISRIRSRPEITSREEAKMPIRTWTLRTLASAALAVVLAAGALAQPTAPANGAKQAAVVNGEAITLAEVDAILKSRPIQSMKPTEADYREMQKEALNMIIDERIMQQFLHKHASAATPAQINKKFRELQDALKTQGQTLEEYYQASGQTEAQVRASIVTTLQWNAYLDKNLTEAALHKYYEEYRDSFDQAEVRVSQILLRLKPGLTAADLDLVRNWLRGVRQDILGRKLDFAEAARKYSQDVSASRGGDLGFIARKGAVEETFARAAFALKTNEISDVIQTASGLHLITVTQRKAGSPSEFKTVEPKIRELAGEEIMSSVLAQERQAAQVKITLGDDQPGKATPAGSHFHPGSR